MALCKILADSCTSYCHSFLSLSFCPFLITSGMISRVEAQRDHSSKDCRFLNFRKGEMITVYYKLTGKRNDLWAGSVSLLFSGSVLNKIVDELKICMHGFNVFLSFLSLLINKNMIFLLFS